jgi:putative ubiquitin-RnfH superfamily antitoxin RatB of RatAB toxin-antitoxin module
MALDMPIHVQVYWSLSPREVNSLDLQLPQGSTIQDALDTAALQLQGFNASWGLSLWGRRVQVQEVLREGDRLEITRPLLVDPKVARRERFATQGAKTAGLFSRKRPGSKPGY